MPKSQRIRRQPKLVTKAEFRKMGLRRRRLLVAKDWTVPSAEELLALHVMISLPGRERYVRDLPEVGGRG